MDIASTRRLCCRRDDHGQGSADGFSRESGVTSSLMRFPAALMAVALIGFVLWDAFEAIVLPRRVTRRWRLARLFYRLTWTLWSAVARRIASRARRESLLGVYGPLSLLFLLGVLEIGRA